MDLPIFITLFFLTAVFFMPLAAFGYKLCETVHKRSLFGKSAKQIQTFSAVLLFLCGLLLGADYLFKGILFQAHLTFADNASFGFWKNAFLMLLGGSFAGSAAGFLSVKFSKTPLFFVLNAVIGIFLTISMAKFMNNVAVSVATVTAGTAGAAAESTGGFFTYCLRFFGTISALPADAFIENPHALFSSVSLYSVIALFFVLISIFLCSLYLICLFTFMFRNSMDYGRDYYNFILAKYGRAIFLFSVIAFIAACILLAGFALPFQGNVEQILFSFSAQTLYLQWALIIVPLMYFLFSLKLKKSFYTAQIPLQKKSNVLITFVFDSIFSILLFCFVMNCVKF